MSDRCQSCSFLGVQCEKMLGHDGLHEAGLSINRRSLDALTDPIAVEGPGYWGPPPSDRTQAELERIQRELTFLASGLRLLTSLPVLDTEPDR